MMRTHETEKAAILHDAQMKRLMEDREILAYVASQVVDDFRGMGWQGPHPAFLLKKRMCCYLARLVASQKGKVFGGDDYGSLAPVMSVWLILNNPRWDQERIVEWTMAGLLGIYLSRKIGTREKVRRIERDWDLRFSSEDEEEMAMFEGSGMDMWNEAEQSGIQKGLSEGLLKGRRNFAKAILTLSVSLHAPLEQAMDLLKVPRSEREEFLALIGKMQKPPKS